MTIAANFPEAFGRGSKDCAAYYAQTGRGKPQKNNYPSNPYPKPDDDLPWSQRFQSEWSAYNAGWNQAVPT